MIIREMTGTNILSGEETRIAFAVNTEGLNDSGFAGLIARKYWRRLDNIGLNRLGTVLTETVDGITFYGLVCYSLATGWKDQSRVIKECFDNIPGNAPIASVSIGDGMRERSDGANFEEIKKGMEGSKKRIILY